MLDADDLRDLNDPKLTFVSVSPEELALAMTQVESCVACNQVAKTPFDWIIRVVANEKRDVDYILPKVEHCPNCKAEIHEKTLVRPIGGSDAAIWI